MRLCGADIVTECLIEQGCDTVFGYPGGTILNIYDALYKKKDKIRHILSAHEQGAVHAADGYGRSTGKCGVVLATSGPGATNMVTGIATAYMDSSPLVAITCNVSTSLLGKDSFQEIDIVGITMPITKHNFLIKKTEDIAPALRRAFKIATSGRPGPVLVDITKDATANEAEYIKEPPATPEKICKFNEDDIKNAVSLLKSAKKPLIMGGGGIISSNACKELLELSKKLSAPICTTLMGLGAVSPNLAENLGMVGMHGTRASGAAISECDLLIAVGTRFSDRVTLNTEFFARNAKVIHIDIDMAEIDKNVHSVCSLCGDAKKILSLINDRLSVNNTSEWLMHCIKQKDCAPRHMDNGFTPKTAMETLFDITNGDAIIVTDVGQHQMWCAQYYPISKPRELLTSGGLGTMGFGLGAAIGAQVGNPDKTVINIAGDGCFHMNMNELSTAARYGFPVIEIVMNNNVLGMVRQWQTLFYDGRYSETTLDKKTDYDLLAKALGANGFTVRTSDEFSCAVKAAMADKTRPSLINCLIETDSAVLPMVPGGGNIENPIMEV